LRRPEAMMKGFPYKLTALAREKSKFTDKRTGADVFKALAVYQDFGMVFYTYMPWQFDNKPDEYFDKINKDILAEKDIRVVFYGKIGQSVEIELLLDGQGTEMICLRYNNQFSIGSAYLSMFSFQLLTKINLKE